MKKSGQLTRFSIGSNKWYRENYKYIKFDQSYAQRTSIVIAQEANGVRKFKEKANDDSTWDRSAVHVYRVDVGRLLYSAEDFNQYKYNQS